MRLLILLTLLPIVIVAQKNVDPQPYSNTINAADLKKHLYVIAGKEMEGRETATRGERRAASYISNHFQQAGLKPGNKGSYLMPFPLYLDSLASLKFIINGKPCVIDQEYFFTMSGHSMSMNFDSVLYLLPFDRDSINNVYVTGRLVMAHDHMLLHEAFSRGAAAGIFIHPDFKPGNAWTGNDLMLSKFRTYMMPYTFTISQQIARSIIGENYDPLKFAENKAVSFPANIEMEVIRHKSEVFARNVIGVVEGTDKKDEYVFITAHYDHNGKFGDSIILYGADDNGSGTAAILELAEAFAKAKADGKGPRRSIVFMTVSGEEKGLWGSDFYTTNPIFPLEKTSVDLNIDMIGRIDSSYKGDSLNYIYTIGEHKLSSDLEKITNKVNKKYTRLGIDRKFNDPEDPQHIYERSDHYNFAKKGVPVIFYFNGVHRDYHKSTDTPDKIDYPLLEKRTRLIFYTAWEIANREEMLKRDMPL